MNDNLLTDRQTDRQTDRLNVLIMSDFCAACSGNFIASLLALSEKVCEIGGNVYFMFPLNSSGGEQDWIEYIRSFGYEVFMYNREAENEENKELIKKIIIDKKITLIHNHFSCCDQIILWDKEIHSMAKILYHDHMDYVAETPVKPQLKKQIKRAKRYREYGIGVISVMKRKHRGYFLTPKKWYIANGISFKRNVERSLSREECRKELNIADDEVLCLFLGWDIYRKGLDIAIKAILKLRENNPNIVLGVVGFEGTPSEKSIENITKIVGFDPRLEGIRFLDSMEDMYALHRASDVYISASRTEAFAYGILEAISQNVPVVVSDISGTKWSWKYSKCIHFKNENVEQCADAIMNAIPRRDETSNNREIVEKYNIDDWCDKVIKVYKKML